MIGRRTALAAMTLPLLARQAAAQAFPDGPARGSTTTGLPRRSCIPRPTGRRW